MYNSVWFNSLAKPALNPPAKIFSPVWAVLYAMIFLSLFIFIRTSSVSSKTKGYIYFALQLLLNVIWSPVFFLMKNIGLALIIIILLDLFVLMTIRNFYRISKTAAMLLVPYFLWIIFATYLNVSYFVLNR